MSSIIASPSVRKRAADRGIDLERLAADLGRTTIGAEDLSAGAPAPGAAGYWDVDHAKYGEISREPLTRFARVAAANLAAAQARIPAVTHHDRADVSAIEDLRRTMRPEGRARGVRLTALAFHVAALARCLLEFPRFNASLTSDGKDLILKHYVHIGIAVDTAHGLMVPVIRDAGKKRLWQIAAEIADLAARAQNRKLAPEDMGGGSMTITNLGGIGGRAFTPIVNPPEVAILGITRTETVPWWDGEAFRPVPMVPLDLSYDHRVINGADAARFLSHYAGLLADPRRIMI